MLRDVQHMISAHVIELQGHTLCSPNAGFKWTDLD